MTHAVRQPWWRRLFGAYVHEGAYGYVGFVCLGLALELLSLPPGPLPFLVLVADAPFLWLLHHRAGRRWKRWAFLYGALRFGFAVRWLAEIHPVQVLGAALVLAPVYLLFGFAVRLLVFRRVPMMLAVGACAVLEEMLRTVWMGGMPWPARSLSFAGDAPLDLGMGLLLPASAWLGGYAFSFLAGMASAVVFFIPALPAIDPQLRGAARKRLLRAACVPLGFLALLAGLAALRRAQVGELRETEGVIVAVQGNVPQALKHAGDAASTKELFDRHVRLSAAALAALPEGQRAFAVLWPETMVPWPFVSPDLAARFPEYWEDEVGVLRRIRADVPAGRDLEWLIGAIYQFRRGQERHVKLWDHGSHDSLFHLRPRDAPPMTGVSPAPDHTGRPPAWELGRHDKVKLVPGGEYTPLGEVLPPLRWFRNFVSVIPELDPGEEDQPPFEVVTGKEDGAQRISCGTVICFELAFPAECRSWRRRGAEVLLNAANYGWFGRTGFRDQIQAVARLRAAELGATVVMAGNTGPTAFYDPLGRTYGWFTSAEGEEVAAGGLRSTFREGWARAPVRLDEGGPTGYARWGDGPWWALTLVLLLLALRAARSEAQPANASAREGIG